MKSIHLQLDELEELFYTHLAREYVDTPWELDIKLATSLLTNLGSTLLDYLDNKQLPVGNTYYCDVKHVLDKFYDTVMNVVYTRYAILGIRITSLCGSFILLIGE